MNACACADHACSSWGPLFAIHTPQGPIPLCRHCFTMGHSWQAEYAAMRQKEEQAEDFPEGPDTIWIDPYTEAQRDADRWHGRSA